jgi:hypothetical protein
MVGIGGVQLPKIFNTFTGLIYADLNPECNLPAILNHESFFLDRQPHQSRTISDVFAVNVHSKTLGRHYTNTHLTFSSSCKDDTLLLSLGVLLV